MFGYVRVRTDALSTEELAGYEAAYCGLCHRIGERYGNVARMFLNYDFVFLSLLLSPGKEPLPARCRKCIRHPLEGKPACKGEDWMDLAAGESVILTWWKLRDTVEDGGFFSRLGARFLCLLLRPGYRKARGDYAGFDARTGRLLAQLRVLEAENCSSMDRTADCFAGILEAAAPETGEAGLDRPRRQLLYHLGRWIYLIDAVEDLAEDQKAGRYNPVAARFPAWSAEDQAYLRQSMDHSLALAGGAFQLLKPNGWEPVLENILYSGLPGVEELVFSGRWREAQKKHRRSAYERSL